MNAILRSLATLGAIATLTMFAEAAPVHPAIAASSEAPADMPSAGGLDPSGTPGSAMPYHHGSHAATAADMPPQHGGMMPDMGGAPDGATPEMMRNHHRIMMEMHGHHPGAMGGAPLMPGQDAFGAIQEIVDRLEADPTTDWSKVDLEALRQHLIDMNEVTLRAEAVATLIDGGLAIAVTGMGRTRAAIQRMVPAHAREIDGLNHWRVRSETLADGVTLKVTSSDAKQTQRIRGLGFIGILVSGSHHRPHHLAIAKGDFPHAH